MKVTIGQINTTNGDFEGNVAKILSAIEKAKNDDSDLIVFPEVATHGYTSQDWFLDKDIIETADEHLQKIIDAIERNYRRRRHDSAQTKKRTDAGFLIRRR